MCKLKTVFFIRISAKDTTPIFSSICYYNMNHVLSKFDEIIIVYHLFADFMSLQLINGHVVLYVDYGSGTVKLENRHIDVSDGELHTIDILLTRPVSVT